MVLGRRKKVHSWNDKVTNEFFLWKKLVVEERRAGIEEPVRQEESFLWSSMIFSPFLESLSRFDRPTILDLGPITSRNINFYGELGWKVHVYDILGEYREAVEAAKANPPQETGEDEEESPPDPIENILKQLNYPPGSLQGVLCWDILDRFSPVWTQALIRRISSALDEGGVVLSIFGCNGGTADDAHRGFRIRDENHLEPLPDTGSKLERYIYENGEIMSLFGDYKVLNFYLRKNQFREILVQKECRARLRFSA
ncbi:MAG: hypothetical protein ACE5JS_08895 [Nitrospinota bacterium]